MRYYSNQLDPDMDGKEVTVAGWVYELRDFGGVKFIILRDRHGYIQIVIPKKKVDSSVLDAFSKLTKESAIRVRGIVKRSEKAKAGFEILPKTLEVLKIAETPLPMDVSGKIESEMDTRLDNRFLDIRQDKVRAVFMLRDLFLQGMRKAMRDMGFVEVNNPKIAAAGAEGGASLFPVQYFDQWAFLTQSPQLYKQMLMSSSLDRVFEIGPAFRAEPSDTSRHLSEFTSFDFEMAFIQDYNDVMDAAERLLIETLKFVRKNGEEWLGILDRDIEIPKTPLPRLTFDEVKGMLEKRGRKVGKDLGTEDEKELGRIMAEEGYVAYFITDYPEEEKPFYIMENEDRPGHSFAFDLDYYGEELASGGQREHRYNQLIERMRKKGLNPKNFEFYLRAFRYGMPPHGGIGLGVERFIMRALRLNNIREAVLFPRDQWRLVP